MMTMKKQWVDWWGLLLDVGEAILLEVAEAAVRERKRQRSRRRLKL